MKFLHIADLHLGKLVHGFDMQEEQRHWIEQFVQLASQEKPQAIVIAGDVYDRAQPSDAAVNLLDYLLSELSALVIPVMMVAGNHDSASKLSFGREILGRQGIYISGCLRPKLTRVSLRDEYGEVDFTLMPYVFPAAVREVFQKKDIADYTEAVRYVLNAQNIDKTHRNVLIAHQNVTCNQREAERSGSESTIGGVGGVEYTVFQDFDYVALGHIHATAEVGRASIRYAGTPICYHFNETKQGDKGAILVEIDGSGAVTTRRLSIPPLHPMREVRGTLREVLSALMRISEECHVGVVVTDCRLTPEDNQRIRDIVGNSGSRLFSCRDAYCDDIHVTGVHAEQRRARTTAELFSDFYADMMKTTPDSSDAALLKKIDEIVCHSGDWKDEDTPSEAAINEVLQFLALQEENV